MERHVGCAGAASPRVTPRRTVDALGGTVPLYYDFRHWMWRSERCVEIGLGRRALAERAPADVLEVGNVLALAGVSGHTVVDKYERGLGVINVDVLDYKPPRRFGLAVSLSTLEHVGWDEEPREPEKAPAALERLGGMADDLLVTIPVGFHRQLEQSFIDGPFDRVELVVKTSRLARWEQRTLAAVGSVRYGAPYACGNGVLIGSRGLAAATSR